MCQLHPDAKQGQDSDGYINGCWACWMREQEAQEPAATFDKGKRGMTNLAMFTRSVACPACGSQSGEPCYTNRGQQVKGHHYARRKAARQKMYEERNETRN